MDLSPWAARHRVCLCEIAKFEDPCSGCVSSKDSFAAHRKQQLRIDLRCERTDSDTSQTSWHLLVPHDSKSCNKDGQGRFRRDAGLPGRHCHPGGSDCTRPCMHGLRCVTPFSGAQRNSCILLGEDAVAVAYGLRSLAFSTLRPQPLDAPDGCSKREGLKRRRSPRDRARATAGPNSRQTTSSEHHGAIFRWRNSTATAPDGAASS